LEARWQGSLWEVSVARRNTVFAVLVFAVAITIGNARAETKTAIFAGGCFWCVESDFDAVPGVLATTSGYIGGTSRNPTYQDYSAAGHREAVKIDYDSTKVNYATLLDIFWHSVDPTDGGGQFCDRGHSYSTAIYALNAADLQAAKKSKAAIAAELGKPIATDIVAASTFWPAEEYHQNYYRKNPLRYNFYRSGCGRDNRVESLWGASAHKGIAGH
jgi:peptide-methionine (S)-S-oxide reductase